MNPAEPERGDPRHPIVQALDGVVEVLPDDVPLAAISAAGRGLNAAGELFEAGVRAAGEAVVDAAGSVDWGDVASVAGDVAGAAAEGLGDVAGAVIEGIGDIAT